MAAGTGGTADVDDTGEYIFQVAASANRAAGCTSIRVANDSGSTDSVKVLVTGLHDSGAEDVLAAGEEGIYRWKEQAIRNVYVKSTSGTQTIRWGVRARTGASA